VGSRAIASIRRGSYGLGPVEADRVVQANGAWWPARSGDGHLITTLSFAVELAFAKQSNMRSETPLPPSRILPCLPLVGQKGSEFRLQRS